MTSSCSKKNETLFFAVHVVQSYQSCQNTLCNTCATLDLARRPGWCLLVFKQVKAQNKYQGFTKVPLENYSHVFLIF